jgi:hypothetical protein
LRRLPAHRRPEPLVISIRAIAPIGTTFSTPVKAIPPGDTVVGATLGWSVVVRSVVVGWTVVGPTVAVLVGVELVLVGVELVLVGVELVSVVVVSVVVVSVVVVSVVVVSVVVVSVVVVVGAKHPCEILRPA